MSEKMFETRMDDIFDGIINITRNGENLAWFFTDSITDEQVGKICDLLNEQQSKIKELEEEKIELEKKLECCEYEHFINELDKIHEKIDKGDYSDFKPLKQEEKDKQIEEDYARLQRRKILERSGNCKPLTLKYNPNIRYVG